MIECDTLFSDKFHFRKLDEFVLSGDIACPDVDSDYRYLCQKCADGVLSQYIGANHFGKEEVENISSQFNYSRLKIALFLEVTRNWKGPGSLAFELWEALK